MDSAGIMLPVPRIVVPTMRMIASLGHPMAAVDGHRDSTLAGLTLKSLGENPSEEVDWPRGRELIHSRTVWCINRLAFFSSVRLMICSLLSGLH